MEVMWSLYVLLLCVAAARCAPPLINVTCHSIAESSSESSGSNPSYLDELKVVPLDGQNHWRLNISWAIRIDNTVQYLTGTLIRIQPSGYNFHCVYHPPFAEVDSSRLDERVWFHFLVHLEGAKSIDPGGDLNIDGRNLPTPQYTSTDVQYVQRREIQLPDYFPDEASRDHPPDDPIVTSTDEVSTSPGPTVMQSTDLVSADPLVPILGCLAGLLALACSVTLYKVCRWTSSFRFSALSEAAPPATVSVLVVYPAENPVFHNAVVALAEFLRRGSGCSVAIDLWQRGQLAELGPMRWLAQQANVADRVLVVCPPHGRSPAPSTHLVDRTAVPASTEGDPASEAGSSQGPAQLAVPAAAAHDLFPLVMNMVASQARSPSQMARFWVVHLGVAPERNGLPVELRACRKFCLMKDMKKLCRELHGEQGRRRLVRSDQGNVPAGQADQADHEKATEKLRDAVRELGTWQCSSQLQSADLVPLTMV